MTNERRRNRSDMVQEAVRLYLEAVVERSRIKAMALANEEGLLVAGAGKGYDHEWLAALGVITSESHRSRVQHLIVEVSGGEGISSWDVTVHGRKLRMSVVGTAPTAEDTSIALSRIFAPLFGGAPSIASS